LAAHNFFLLKKKMGEGEGCKNAAIMPRRKRGTEKREQSGKK